MAGLGIFGAAFAWIAVSPTFMSYWVIVGQMILMGTGLGLTSTPATNSILGVLPRAKTGVGSAVNDATREAGGTLGVAVIGSVFTSLYTHRLADTAFGSLPPGQIDAARSSIAAAVHTVANAPLPLRGPLVTGFENSFMTGLHVACLVAAAVCWVGAAGAFALPGKQTKTAAVFTTQQ